LYNVDDFIISVLKCGQTSGWYLFKIHGKSEKKKNVTHEHVLLDKVGCTCLISWKFQGNIFCTTNVA